MPALFGPVLTNARSADHFLAYNKLGGFSAAKVITSWGLDTGWNDTLRYQVGRHTPRLVVRSTHGDPSNLNALWYLDPYLVVEEFRPWVAYAPHAWLELGNEPDVYWDGDENRIWQYRYWLRETVQAMRAAFPGVRLISPAVRVGEPGWERWYEIMADVIKMCDSVGVHIYGWHKLLHTHETDDTGQFVKAHRLWTRLFPEKTVAVTEMGIHDPGMPKAEKLRLYREFARLAPQRWTWCLFYHLCEDQAIQPEYDIPLTALAEEKR